MQYIIHIKDQKKVIQMFSNEARFHEIKDQLVNAFHKLKIYKVIIKQALRTAEKEKNY